MQIMCTHFIFFYGYVLIQEQNYEHFSNGACLHTKCPSEDDVYWSKQAVCIMKSILNRYTYCDGVLLYVICNLHSDIRNCYCKFVLILYPE